MRIQPLTNWLDERLSISTLTKLADKKEVPLHRHSIWYYFGGMTLFLFVVQVTTGILLLLTIARALRMLSKAFNSSSPRSSSAG